MKQLDTKDLASSLPVLPRLDRLDLLVITIFLCSLLFVHYTKKNNCSRLFVTYNAAAGSRRETWNVTKK